MGCSCRTFREEPLTRPSVSHAEPLSVPAPQVMKGSRDPALGILPMTRWGGVLVLGETHLAVTKKDWGWKWR
jgi:hypothetical protein